jgi:hypothetical protein
MNLMLRAATFGCNAVVLLGVVNSVVSAQGPVERRFDDLRREVAQVNTSSALSVRLRWMTGAPVADPAQTQSKFEVLSTEEVTGTVRAERAPQLGRNSLVVVSVDAGERELDWRIVADPRLVRAEAEADRPDRGEPLYYLDADLRLLLPNLADTTHIRIYTARRGNPEAPLRLLATMPIR